MPCKTCRSLVPNTMIFNCPCMAIPHSMLQQECMEALRYRYGWDPRQANVLRAQVCCVLEQLLVGQSQCPALLCRQDQILLVSPDGAGRAVHAEVPKQFARSHVVRPGWGVSRRAGMNESPCCHAFRTGMAEQKPWSGQFHELLQREE